MKISPPISLDESRIPVGMFLYGFQISLSEKRRRVLRVRFSRVRKIFVVPSPNFVCANTTFRKYSRVPSLRYTPLDTLLIFVTHFAKTILNRFCSFTFESRSIFPKKKEDSYESTARGNGRQNDIPKTKSTPQTLLCLVTATRCDFRLSNPVLSFRKKERRLLRVFFLFFGKGGIRTLERVLAVTRFPVVRLRPTQPPFHGEARLSGYFFRLACEPINSISYILKNCNTFFEFYFNFFYFSS